MELPDVVDLTGLGRRDELEDRGVGSEDPDEVVLGELFLDVLRLRVATEINGENSQLWVHLFTVLVDCFDVTLSVVEVLADHHVAKDDHVVYVLLVGSSFDDNLYREVSSSSKSFRSSLNCFDVSLKIACKPFIHEYVALISCDGTEDVVLTALAATHDHQPEDDRHLEALAHRTERLASTKRRLHRTAHIDEDLGHPLKLLDVGDGQL